MQIIPIPFTQNLTAMNWLQNISITCFAASYAVVFALEISRIFFDVSFRKYVRVGFAAAGLFAHSVFLVLQGKLVLGSNGLWLGSWFGWCLATAWILAFAYIWISARQPKSVIGLFLIPLILGLIGLGVGFGTENQFNSIEAKSIWNMVHGFALLLGTAIVALGFVFGVVYVVQSRRLKHKSPQSKHFRLPSLEWLQKSSEYSLVISTFLLAIGLISGIAINWTNQTDGALSGGGTIAWSNPVIWSSGILFSWLLLVSIFSFCYQPSRQGRKVAYLVIASFLFLVLELAIVWWVGHATASSKSKVARHSKISSISKEFHNEVGRLKI